MNMLSWGKNGYGLGDKLGVMREGKGEEKDSS